MFGCVTAKRFKSAGTVDIPKSCGAASRRCPERVEPRNFDSVSSFRLSRRRAYPKNCSPAWVNVTFRASLCSSSQFRSSSSFATCKLTAEGERLTRFAANRKLPVSQIAANVRAMSRLIVRIGSASLENNGEDISFISPECIVFLM